MSKKDPNSKRLFFGVEVFAPYPSSFPPGRMLDRTHRHLTLAFLGQIDFSKIANKMEQLPKPKSFCGTVGYFDEYVWREINQVIEKNPHWRGISVMATEPGHFVVTGYVENHEQADRLSDYLSANFPYPDLLEKKVVDDEEVVANIHRIFEDHGLKHIDVKLEKAEVTLAGGIPKGKENNFADALKEVRSIRGIRNVRNMTTGLAQEESVINISDKYEVSGVSSHNGNLSVVINGRILMKGDILDGMTITSIQSNAVFLDKDGGKYRIDFKH